VNPQVTTLEAHVIQTRLTAAFGVEHPIVLAPMDVVSDARLAAAVSAAGGLGLVGGGYGDRRWLEKQLGDVPAGRVGCGFITWSLARRPELLDVALDHDLAAVFLSFGDPEPFAARIHAAGVPLICQVSTVAHARRAVEAGARAVVAQGGEAGGHSTGNRSTFTLVPEIADLLAHTAPDTLLLAAGGVADGRGLGAALCLGADGVVVGTRMWASAEAVGAAQAQRTALAHGADDTIRSTVYDLVREVDWPEIYNGRILRNDFVDRWHGDEQQLRERLPELRATFEQAKADDDYSIGNVIVGEGIGLIHEIEPAAVIVERMVREAEAALSRH
jgi:nitronate monooxygenase